MHYLKLNNIDLKAEAGYPLVTEDCLRPWLEDCLLKREPTLTLDASAVANEPDPNHKCNRDNLFLPSVFNQKDSRSLLPSIAVAGSESNRRGR